MVIFAGLQEYGDLDFSQVNRYTIHGDTTRLNQLVMQSTWYRRIFPNTRLQHGKSALHDLHTTKRGYRLSTSVGGTLTGRGADMVILDDINKANEIQSDHQRQKTQNWFQGTLMSRLNNKATEPIIVVQQRLHDDDLVGFLQRNGCWTDMNSFHVGRVLTGW